ncbi:unnamed protein product, partial [marine sediment metagenome]
LLDYYIGDSEITIKLDYTSIYFKDKAIFFPYSRVMNYLYLM